jgi:hypothetical protein
VTAIRAGGGNADLAADPDWTPLGVTATLSEILYARERGAR